MMTRRRKALLSGLACLVSVPVILGVAAYALNPKMLSDDVVQGLYADAVTICADPYSTDAYDDLMQQHRDIITAGMNRAKSEEKKADFTRKAEALPYTELLAAAITCERAVMAYSGQVQDHMYDRLDTYADWRAQWNRDCTRYFDVNRAERFSAVRHTSQRAERGEIAPKVDKVKARLERQLTWQPWRARATLRLCL